MSVIFKLVLRNLVYTTDIDSIAEIDFPRDSVGDLNRNKSSYNNNMLSKTIEKSKNNNLN